MGKYVIVVNNQLFIAHCTKMKRKKEEEDFRRMWVFWALIMVENRRE
jgi:hypothetical protein